MVENLGCLSVSPLPRLPFQYSRSTGTSRLHRRIAEAFRARTLNPSATPITYSFMGLYPLSVRRPRLGNSSHWLIGGPAGAYATAARAMTVNVRACMVRIGMGEYTRLLLVQDNLRVKCRIRIRLWACDNPDASAEMSVGIVCRGIGVGGSYCIITVRNQGDFV